MVDESGGLFYCLWAVQELTHRLVGTIGHQTDLSMNTRSGGLLSIHLPTLPSTPGEIEHEVTNAVRRGAVLQEPRPPSRSEYPPQSIPGRTREVNADTDGSIFESIPLIHDDPMVDLSHIQGQFSSTTPVYNRSSYYWVMTGSSVPRKRRHSEVDDTEATPTGFSGGSVDDNFLRCFLRNIDSLTSSQEAVSDIVCSFQIC